MPGTYNQLQISIARDTNYKLTRETLSIFKFLNNLFTKIYNIFKANYSNRLNFNT
jgi:hypothetical protein